MQDYMEYNCRRRVFFLRKIGSFSKFESSVFVPELDNMCLIRFIVGGSNFTSTSYQNKHVDVIAVSCPIKNLLTNNNLSTGKKHSVIIAIMTYRNHDSLCSYSHPC
jgi:hypothetical protein